MLTTVTPYSLALSSASTSGLSRKLAVAGDLALGSIHVVQNVVRFCRELPSRISSSRTSAYATAAVAFRSRRPPPRRGRLRRGGWLRDHTDAGSPFFFGAAVAVTGAPVAAAIVRCFSVAFSSA